MDTSRARSFVLVALAVLLGMVTGAAPGYAGCDPTTDPDKTDIANARSAVAANCGCAAATGHGAYVSCAVQQVNVTLFNKSCAGAVKRCASRSTCGRPAGTVTCCLTRPTGTKCYIKRDAAHCKARRGTACVGIYPSCCDACGVAGCATTTSTTPTTTTSTSSTTTTTCPPTHCGNGVYEPQCGEQCDGTSRSCDFFPFPPGACIPPGEANECQCCGLDQSLCALPHFGIDIPCCAGAGFTCALEGPSPSHLYTMGFCSTPCVQQSDCPAGKACMCGGCRATFAPCTQSSECPSGYLCLNGGCLGNFFTCDLCTFDPGFACIDGLCFPTDCSQFPM